MFEILFIMRELFSFSPGLGWGRTALSMRTVWTVSKTTSGQMIG